MFTDVGTVASTIMYSFYLNVTSKSDQLCTVPIININRANLGSHVELKWLLDSCQIDQSSLIFADEVSLIYVLITQKYFHLSFVMYIEVDAIYENVKQKNKEKDVDI